MELRLVVELDGAGHLIRQRRLRHERCRQAQLLHHLGLLLELSTLLVLLRHHVVRLALEVAVDSAGPRQPRDPLDRALIRLRIDARTLLAELVGQLSVDDAVTGGDLGGRVAGRGAGDPAPVEQCDRLTGLFEQGGRGHAGDARPHDGHVDGDLAGELWVARFRGRRDPDRLPTLRHRGSLTTIAAQ
jgi:hypothetical protein